MPNSSKPQVQWEPEAFALGLLSSYARTSLNHPAKLRLIRTLAAACRTKIAVHTCGGRLAIDESDFIGWALLTKGMWEPQSVQLSITLMRSAQGGIFLDVGANQGLFSVAVAAATECKAVAIEPDVKNFSALLGNIALNSSLDIHPVQSCATSTPTIVQLSQEEEGRKAWTSVSQGAHEASRAYVPGLPLDVILPSLGVTRVHLLKIDVEGYETSVFAGLDWAGFLRPSYVIMECSPRETAKIEYLCSRGYHAETVNGGPITGLDAFPEGNVLFKDSTLAK